VIVSLLLAMTVGQSQAETVRVVTFNVLHGGPWSGLIGNGDDLNERLEIAVEQLAALRPDVVALQEASVGGNTTSQVFGIGWLDRAITSAIRFNEGSHGPLDFYSTHTSRDDCQLRRVAELVGARRGPLPAIVAGDFNTREDAGAYAELLGAGFVDAFRAVNPGTNGSTSRQLVHAAQSTVARRIDFVFVVPGANGVSRVLESRVVLDIPRRRADGTTLWPSDHYGVLAVIEIPTNGAN